MKKFIKFMISSGISCAIDFGLFTLIKIVLNRLYGGDSAILSDYAIVMIATVGARIVSSFCNYMINRKAVFKSDDRMSILRYYTVVVVQMILSGTLVSLLSTAVKSIIPASAEFELTETIVKCVVDFCLFFASFTIQKEWVFKKHE